MKTNPMNKMIAVAAGLAASLAISAQAGTIDYDFDTLGGWNNVKSSTAAAGYVDLSFSLVPGYHMWNADAGHSYLAQSPEANDGGAHQSLWIQSPAFTFDGSPANIGWYGFGKDSGGSLVGYSVPEVASPTGVIGVALRDLTTGQFVLSQSFNAPWNWTYDSDPGPGDVQTPYENGGFGRYDMTAAQLAPFLNTGHVYTLNLIDTMSGAGNWAGFDGLKLEGVVPSSVPEPSSLALLGLGGLALMLRKRK